MGSSEETTVVGARVADLRAQHHELRGDVDDHGRQLARIDERLAFVHRFVWALLASIVAGWGSTLWVLLRKGL